MIEPTTVSSTLMRPRSGGERAQVVDARGRAGSRAGRTGPAQSEPRSTARLPAHLRGESPSSARTSTASSRYAAATRCGGDLDAGAVEHRLPVDELRAARLAEPRAALGRARPRARAGSGRAAARARRAPSRRGRRRAAAPPGAGPASTGRRRPAPSARAAGRTRATRPRRASSWAISLRAVCVLDRVLGDHRRPLGLRRASLIPRPPRAGSSGGGGCGRRRAGRCRRGGAPGAA